MLRREQMARATEISLLTGQGKNPRPHIHGVEQVQGSKFQADGKDYSSVESTYSSDESDEDEEASTPLLVKEALEAGFTVDQLSHAEAELGTPLTGHSKVCNELQEGLMSK